MANSTKPTLLLIHGAWHYPASYGAFTSALRHAGFEVHCPRLLTMNGSRPPNADLTSDTDLIRSYATSLVDAGRTVAVVMHSYGGQVGTNALFGLSKKARATQGLPGGISHLIYMCGFALPEGKSMVDKVDEFGHMDRMPVAFNFDQDQSCVPNYPKEGLVGEPFVDRIDSKVANDFFASLGRFNGKGMYQGIENTSAWRDDTKICYIQTLGDLTVPNEYQKNMIEYIEKEKGTKVQTVELDSGHSPSLTAQKETVEAIVSFTAAD